MLTTYHSERSGIEAFRFLEAIHFSVVPHPLEIDKNIFSYLGDADSKSWPDDVLRNLKEAKNWDAEQGLKMRWHQLSIAERILNLSYIGREERIACQVASTFLAIHTS